MSSNSILHSGLSKTKSKGGGGDDGGYTIQLLERLTKIETQISHLASKEDVANVKLLVYKVLFFSTSTIVTILGVIAVKVLFFS